MEYQKEEVFLLGLRIRRRSPQEFLNQMDLFLEQEKMNTIALLTVPALLEASESDRTLEVFRNADCLVPAEPELFALLREGDGRVYADDAIYLLFSRFTEQYRSAFILEDTRQEAEIVKQMLERCYPGMRILGCAGAENLDDTEADNLINEINSMEAGLIISSLLGNGADAFMLQHKAKITSNIWINLGRHRKLQAEAGIKVNKVKSLTVSMNWNSLARNAVHTPANTKADLK